MRLRHGLGDRFYRSFSPTGERRVPFRVCIDTTDLYLRADRDLSAQTRQAAAAARHAVEEHIAVHPWFATALAPLAVPPGKVPELVREMYAAGWAAGVGPMAAVAGAVAEYVGRALRPLSREVLVENGGDIYLDMIDEVVVGLFAGASPFSGRLGLRLAPASTPVAVCTSSASVGPSRSAGIADAAVVIGTPAATADAVATALGNRVHRPADLEPATQWALGIPGVRGAVAVLGDRLAAVGEVEFTPVA